MKINISNKIQTLSEYGSSARESKVVGIESVSFWFNPHNESDVAKAEIVLDFISKTFEQEISKSKASNDWL